MRVSADALDEIESGKRDPSADEFLRGLAWLRCDLSEVTTEARR
jgi:hypothetical protein